MENCKLVAEAGWPMPQTYDVATAAVTAFICVNCARSGQKPDSGGRSCPSVPGFDWPVPVQEVLVPCTGRLQPEHVLKAFEHGADLVLTVSCEGDNCQYLQGSERWARRADYLKSVLDEVGLGGDRLMLFHLPGSATEDMALGAGQPARACPAEASGSQITEIRDTVLRALDHLTPNPLGRAPVAEPAGQTHQEPDRGVQDDED